VPSPCNSKIGCVQLRTNAPRFIKLRPLDADVEKAWQLSVPLVLHRFPIGSEEAASRLRKKKGASRSHRPELIRHGALIS
jgi:hypothetical protein